MKRMLRHAALVLCAVALLAGAARAQRLTPEMKAKVEEKARAFAALGADPQIVSAVRNYNQKPNPDGMTNVRWKGLTLIDPIVRAYTKNALAQHLKATREPGVTELFVSGADGGKVAFLSKTTSWSHKGAEKHEAPMRGQIFIGPEEVDESSGQLQVQVGIPVLDGKKPIGSIVIGLDVSKL